MSLQIYSLQLSLIAIKRGGFISRMKFRISRKVRNQRHLQKLLPLRRRMANKLFFLNFKIKERRQNHVVDNFSCFTNFVVTWIYRQHWWRSDSPFVGGCGNRIHHSNAVGSSLSGLGLELVNLKQGQTRRERVKCLPLDRTK